MPGFVGLPELLLFGIVALLIFGPKKLPEMGRSLGKGLREFKDSVSGTDRPDTVEGQTTTSATTPTVARLDAADTQPDPLGDTAVRSEVTRDEPAPVR